MVMVWTRAPLTCLKGEARSPAASWQVERLGPIGRAPEYLHQPARDALPHHKRGEIDMNGSTFAASISPLESDGSPYKPRGDGGSRWLALSSLVVPSTAMDRTHRPPTIRLDDDGHAEERVCI